MIPFIGDPYSQTYRERKENSGYQKWWGEKNEELLLTGTEFRFYDISSIKMDGDDSCTIL